MMICNHHRDEKKSCSCVAAFDAIVTGEDIPRLAGYCAIVREASKHPELLKDYASDLITHDRRFLTDYEGPFLWVLRELGTVCVKPGVSNLTVKGIVTAFGDRECLWFWWDGRALKRVDHERAKDLLDEAVARFTREERRAS